MKIKVITEIEAPDDATHYAGDLLGDHVFYKMKMIADYEHWFSHGESGWFLCGHRRPNFSKEIRSSEDNST